MAFERKNSSNKIQANKQTAGINKGLSFIVLNFATAWPDKRLVKMKRTIPVYIIPIGENNVNGNTNNKICNKSPFIGKITFIILTLVFAIKQLQ